MTDSLSNLYREDCRLVIMRGLPRSGKTTYVKEVILPNHHFVRVSPDDIRLALHGQAFYGPAEPSVWAHALLMTRALLLGGQCVVIDATNLTKASRKQWFSLALDFRLPLYVYDVETPYDICAARNTGEGSVPAHVLERMRDTAQPITSDEGIYVPCPVLPVGLS